MTELIVIAAISTAVFMIISISYKIGHLDGQLKALKEINFIETVDTPQTDIHGLTDCDFCKGKNCEDCEGGKDEPQKKEVEWVYNKRERLWYPYSNGELLFKTENSSEKPNSLE